METKNETVKQAFLITKKVAGETVPSNRLVSHQPLLFNNKMKCGRKRKKIECICEICGKKIYYTPYNIKAGRGKFCSNKCRGIWLSKNVKGKNSSAWKGGKIKIVCKNCNNIFYDYKSNNKKFCSRKCANIWRSQNWKGKNHWSYKGGKVKIICPVCKEEFYAYFSGIKTRDNKFCSKKCSYVWQSKNLIKEKRYNYKGEVGYENRKIRQSLEYQIWRKEIYKKDRWTCRICGSKKDIVAHHLKLFSKFPELRFSVDNGITLCRSCHFKIHF